MDHYPREIGIDPKTGIQFHWIAFQDARVYSSTTAKDVTQGSIHCQPLAAGSIRCSQNVGHNPIHGTGSTQRMAPVPANPMVGQQGLGPDVRTGPNL